MDEKQFWAEYWFKPTQLITVVNPTGKDFIFKATIDVGIDIMTAQPKSATQEFSISAGGHRRLPGPVANLYLDQMFKKLVQEEENDFLTTNPDTRNTPQSGFRVAQIADYGARKQYYDRLIVSNEDTLSSFQSYDVARPLDEEAVQEKAKEVAFESLRGDIDAGSTGTSSTSNQASSQTSDRAKAVASAKK